MANDYKGIPFLYESRGLDARHAQDRVPAGFYIRELNTFEREESAQSSRYGTLIINRDPNGTPGGQNYFFSAPVTSLARFLYQGNSWRYAGLSDGTLQRRQGDAQGPFTQVYAGLSGQPFQSLITNCYETSQPYLFIFDQDVSIKDSPGFIASPQLTGIDPPAYTANSQPYSPLLTLIDNFSASDVYTTSNFSVPWTYTPVTSISASFLQEVTDFPQFTANNSSQTINGGSAGANLTVPGVLTDTSTMSGFTSLPISPAEIVTVSVPVSGNYAATPTGSAPSGSWGNASITYSYSTDGGATWTPFYTYSAAVSSTQPGGTFTPTTAQVSVTGLSNLDNLQIQMTAESFLSVANVTLDVSAGAGTITATVNVSGVFGGICDGILSVLSGASGGTTPGFTSGTVQATQYATNITYNSSQWEFNSNQLRTINVSNGQLLDYVFAYGFGLSVPADATVTGVAVTLYWTGQHAGTGFIKNVSLSQGGASIGVIKPENVSNTEMVITPVTFGGTNDTWGEVLPPALVNSSTFGFGVQIEAFQVGSTTRSFLQTWTIAVYYTTPGGGGGVATVSSTPIVSAQSINEVGGLYQQIQFTTNGPHGLTASNNIAIYGTSNNLADGFYNATATAANMFVVPYVSPVYLTATGGTMYSASNGPNTAMLADEYSTPYPTQFSAFGFYASVPQSVSDFPIGCWEGTVATNTTASVQITEDFNLSINNQVNDNDLIVAVIKVGSPANIASIQLQFDVNGSGYSSSYYTATVSPAYYQGSLVDQLSAYNATQNQILGDALGLFTGQPVGSTTAQLQPSNFSTGSGSWAAVLIPRGNFLPVGNAGQSGLDWTNITGWRVQVQTSAAASTGDGSSTFALNGLYLQWGYGPSSFAGVGYDWRYTYYDQQTGTESSPSPEQFFSKQYGYLASLAAPFYLRQAALVTGQYSIDPQTTHLRMYRRGGIYASNWFLEDQVPNITAGGTFKYKDVVADASLAQAQLLALDNDPPVTSSMNNPIQTTLAAATTGPGSSIYAAFAPQTLSVMDGTAVFVPNQIVAVGNANNLEVVTVISVPGPGQFTTILRLTHNAGEQVSATSIPRQPCDLCVLAYGRVWLAGDPNNPHYLYYSKGGYPENFSPAAYIQVSSPDDPIMGLINWRGTLLVATLKTWWIVANGATAPQPTGAAHGLVAKNGWTLVEGAVVFRAADGWRIFEGADGIYMTLPVEQIFRSSPATIVPQADLNASASDVLAFYQNQIYGSYISASNSQRYRLVYDYEYKRFRQDDVAATAMLWEQDINSFLVAKPISPTEYALAQDWVGDYDDGGWSASNTLIQTPINLDIQVPFQDLGKPHNPKQWNVLEGDYNTQNQAIQTTLYFNTEPQTSLVLPSANTGTQRSKVQFEITPAVPDTAQGYEAYSMSIRHQMAVTVAPVLYQENVYAEVLADERTSWDTYWVKSSGDYLNILPKNVYVDYSGDTPLTVQFFADGNLTPYHTDDFTLIAQVNRSVVRVQGPARKGRIWRIIITAPTPFQLWSQVRCEVKALEEGSGYAQHPFEVYQ